MTETFDPFALLPALPELVLVVGASQATEESVASALELLDCGERIALLLNRSRTGGDPGRYARSYGSPA